MSEYDDHLRSEIDKRRVAFAEHVRQAISSVDSEMYRQRGLCVGVGRSWVNAKWESRPWDDDELREYAGEIRDEIFRMADAGEMTEAGIREHENLELMTVEARLPSNFEPMQGTRAVLDVVISVLGTPLELK